MNAVPVNDDAESPRVDVDVSDLFFNRDLDFAKRFDHVQGRRMFVGWDMADLRAEAVLTLDSLERLGVPNLPTPDKLVEDFINRC